MSIYKLTKIFGQNLNILSIEKGLNFDIIKLQNKNKERFKAMNIGFYGLSRENYINSLVELMKEDIEKKSYTYDKLTDEEKKDIITVDGHKYIRKLYKGV